MLDNLKLKIKESVFSILPITLVVVVISFFLPEINYLSVGLFIFGALMLTTGMVFFSIGADIAIMEIGREVGGFLAVKKNITLILLVPLIMGILIALSEPDIQILGDLFQSNGAKNQTLIIVVSVAVGIMLSISILRTNFNIPLKFIFISIYTLIFILAIFVQFYNPSFLSAAFDSGGIATGPMTVPFLMAFGIGFANVKGGKTQSDNSFGTLGLATAGPILAVLLMSLFYKGNITTQDSAITEINSIADVFNTFFKALPHELLLVAIAIIPTLIVFLILQFTSLKLPKIALTKILMGLIYTFFGLSIFLAAAGSCFMPIGQNLAYTIGLKPYKWVLFPLAILVGSLIALAEPSIHILAKQVDEITGGSISRKFMMIALCSGIGIAAGFGMIRVLTSISIWWFLVPTYVISLALMFIVSPLFTGIAFDSGSAASGPMAATFVLPFTLGACQAVGGNPLTDAFGIVAYISMTPILILQIIGLIYKIKTNKNSIRDLLIKGKNKLKKDNNDMKNNKFENKDVKSEEKTI